MKLRGLRPRGRPRRYDKEVDPDQPHFVTVEGPIRVTGRWPNLDPRREALRLMAEYKIECEKAGRKYRRADAIKKAADILSWDPRSLANWLNRSKRSRES